MLIVYMAVSNMGLSSVSYAAGKGADDADTRIENAINPRNAETPGDNDGSTAVIDDGSGQPANIGPTRLRGTRSAASLENIVITRLNTRLFSGAAQTSDGYVWTAPTSTPGHRFGFRIEFATSGVGEAEPEEVYFIIPKQILRDRYGAFADEYEMSIPTREDYESGEELDDDVNFVYYEDGDNLVIYNIKSVYAGDNGYIELAYATTLSSYNYVDMAPSEPFTCTMYLGKPSAPVSSKTADPIPVKINTTAVINSTEKKYPTLYKTWQSSWGSAPADAADYYYLVWEIHSRTTSTQPFDFSFVDTVKAAVSKPVGNISDTTLRPVEAELVGFRFSGQSGFSTNNARASQRTDGYRYDAVLTKLKKSDVVNYEHWEVTNKIVSTVTPVDGIDAPTSAVSNRKWTWDKPYFSEPTGHFNTYKRADGAWRTYHPSSIYTGTTHRAGSSTMKAGDYTRYDLEELIPQTNTSVKYGGFDYASWVVGYPYPWTYDSSYGSPLTPAAYGRLPVKFELVDEGVHFDDQPERMLTSDDFFFESVNYTYLMRDARINEEIQAFSEYPVTYTDNDILVFYGKFGNSADYVQIGSHNLKTGSITGINSTYVKSFNPGRIVLKDGADMVAYKVTTSNAHYYTEIFTVPNLVLKNSAYVHAYLNDNGEGGTRDSIGITNHNHGSFYRNSGSLIVDMRKEDTDFARISQKDGHIEKRAVSGTNNVKKRYFAVTWKSTVDETIIYGEYGNKGYIPQESGRFYDLLPLGGVLDPDSVQVYDGKRYFGPSEYRVSYIENYQDTGRTMLIVDITTEADLYTVYYDTRHSWNSIKDYGTKLRNSVAFETGNEKITDGRPDDGGTITEKNLMAGLLDGTEAGGYVRPEAGTDKAHTPDDPAFLHAENVFDILALMAANSGLMKKVKDSTDTSYSYSTMTTINGNYSYEIRFQNTPGNKAKNMILFDTLENYYLAETPGADTYVSDWRGKLTGVDTASLVNKGIAPVVYISTIQGLDLEDHHDITDTAVWTRVDSLTPANLAGAKAVAIDIRKTPTGDDFILNEGQSVITHLYMDAPATAPVALGGGYPYAYNNIYIDDTIFDADGTEVQYFIHQDFTKIGLTVAGNFNLHKVSAESESTNIQNIVFRLYGTSAYGTEVDERLTTNSSGSISFRNVEMGTYILQEYTATNDWLLDTTEHTVVVNNQGRVIIDGTDYTDGTITITNRPRIHGDLTFWKKEYNNEDQNVPGVTFRLSGTSDYGTDVMMYGTSGPTGRVRFLNIELGTYELKEISGNPNYVMNDTVYTVKVDETGTATIVDGQPYHHKDANGRDIILNEYRFYNLRLRKLDLVNDTIWLDGAEFHLVGTSDLGTRYDMTRVSGTNANSERGIVEFEDLEKGTYILTETKAPQGVDEQGQIGGTRNYIADPTQYVVVIANDGSITIEGLTEVASAFQVMNDRSLDGEIVVTKRWIDGRDDSTRPIPKLHLTTLDPRTKKITVAYNAKNGTYQDGTSLNSVVYLYDTTQ